MSLQVKRPDKDREGQRLDPILLGSVVICRYKDHVLFKDGDASQYQPWTREAIGWLDYQDKEYVRLVWERFSQPGVLDDARTRSTGLAILRSAILEIRRLG